MTQGFDNTLTRTQLVARLRLVVVDSAVKLSPEQAGVLAMAANQTTLAVMFAAMVVGGNLQAGHDAVRHLVQQQLLTSLNEDTFALADPIRNRLDRQIQTATSVSSPQVARQVPGKRPTSGQSTVLSVG